ncbi:MAG: ABC transporter ATP-binding protein [Acidimicrobiales bacterium]
MRPVSNGEQNDIMTAAATVRLSRKGWGSNQSNHGRNWQFVIDGRVVGSIANAQTIEIPVEPGPHALRVRSMRLLLSPEKPFEAIEGQVVGFSCRSRARSPLFVQRSIIWLFVSLVKHDVWISLKPDETGDGASRQITRAAAPHQPTELELADAGLRTEPYAPASSVARPLPSTDARALDGNEAKLALVVDQLTKRFGGRTAFSEVSFEVAHGEVFGFLGPNGAGKTTTVRALGTLITPTSGTATVAGIPLSPENGMEIRQRISIMPESPGLYLRLTVTENLQYFAGLYGLHPAGPRIKDALEAVNLSDRAGDLCGGLSKGLRQRVGLARTLLSDPVIMFLDEPTSGLDPVAAREVHELINGLRQKGVTIFLTTHRLDEAEKLCDRVAILNTTLRTVGRPEDLREQLFKSALVVKTLAPLSDPGKLFAHITSVEGWHCEDRGSYVLSVSDPRLAAPEVTRSLVGAGADVLSISEAQHSLEDVYLELIDDDVEVRKQ